MNENTPDDRPSEDYRYQRNEWERDNQRGGYQDPQWTARDFGSRGADSRHVEHEPRDSRDHWGRNEFGRGDDRGGSHGSGSYGGARPTSQHARSGDGASSGAHRDSTFDPDYLQWRNEQMRKLDDDYLQWRKERYSKFSAEFNEWRQRGRAAGALASAEATNSPAPAGSMAAGGQQQSGQAKDSDRAVKGASTTSSGPSS